MACSHTFKMGRKVLKSHRPEGTLTVPRMGLHVIVGRSLGLVVMGVGLHDPCRAE